MVQAHMREPAFGPDTSRAVMQQKIDERDWWRLKRKAMHRPRPGWRISKPTGNQQAACPSSCVQEFSRGVRQAAGGGAVYFDWPSGRFMLTNQTPGQGAFAFPSSHCCARLKPFDVDRGHCAVGMRVLWLVPPQSRSLC